MSPQGIARRFVFERGLDLHLGPSGWELRNSPEPLPMSPNDVHRIFRVAPVLMTRALGDDEYTVVLPATSGMRALSFELSEANQRALAVRTGVSWLSFEYAAQGVLYDFTRLALTYTECARRWITTYPLLEKSGYTHTEKVVMGGQTEPYFDFEALMAAVRRAFEMLRAVMWEIAGLSGSRPQNFEKTLAECERLRPGHPLWTTLRASWESLGRSAKDYRDCALHYVSPGGPLPHAIVDRLERGAWGVTARIPDNPQVRSAAAFAHELQLDALSYGWKVTDGVVAVASAVSKALPDRRADP